MEDENPFTQALDTLAEVTGDPTDETDFTSLLLEDASNGFNELGRKQMLWAVRHLWAAGSRFAFNCYRHSAQLILVRGNGQPAHILLSREGVTQGDPLSMILYGVALVPLIRFLKAEHPTLIQAWYADDGASLGWSDHQIAFITHLQRHGPHFGIYLNVDKCICIVREADLEKARNKFEQFGFVLTTGARYLGGFVGMDENRDEWIDAKVNDWVHGIKELAKAAKKYPQTAYASLTKSLQLEWQYL